jgi:hypothetical protein
VSTFLFPEALSALYAGCWCLWTAGLTLLCIRLILPSGDRNEWYYPSRPYDSDDDELQAGTPMGNWGRKHLKSARFVRKGKMAAWGPGREEYDVRLIILLESITTLVLIARFSFPVDRRTRSDAATPHPP